MKFKDWFSSLTVALIVTCVTSIGQEDLGSINGQILLYIKFFGWFFAYLKIHEERK